MNLFQSRAANAHFGQAASNYQTETSHTPETSGVQAKRRRFHNKQPNSHEGSVKDQKTAKLQIRTRISKRPKVSKKAFPKKSLILNPNK